MGGTGRCKHPRFWYVDKQTIFTYRYRVPFGIFCRTMPHNSVDILEDRIPRELLEILLVDHTTGKNIIWATDIGGHKEHDSIQVKDIVGVNGLVLRPRVKKSEEEKKLRTKKRAEVFTPSWVCNEQLNAADNLWFFGSAEPGSGSPFNSPMGKRWRITDDNTLRKVFEDTGKCWQQYILEDKIEMCCGEGPYLTSRYDVVTEREIPVKERACGSQDGCGVRYRPRRCGNAAHFRPHYGFQSGHIGHD